MVISNVNLNLCLGLGVIGYTSTQLNTAIEFLLTDQAQILQFNYRFKDHKLTLQINKKWILFSLSLNPYKLPTDS